MNFSSEQIEQASKRLKERKSSLLSDEIKELKFIVNSNKTETSPREPLFSNRSFFHLKDFPCSLSIDGQSLEGKFTHEDYTLFYEFKSDDGQLLYFEGGEEFEGEMIYENYKPFHLILSAKYPLTNKDIIIANNSLTNSML